MSDNLKTTIAGLAIASSRNGSATFGSLDMATNSALECLGSNFIPNKLGVLIYTGIFRDEHICEPSQAALIQQKIETNLYPFGNEGATTFSYDLANGDPGLLMGIQAIDCFIQTHDIRFGMVVTSDIDITSGLLKQSDFDAGGGAILLKQSEVGDCFSEFYFESFNEYSDLFQAEVSWVKSMGHDKTDQYEHALIFKYHEDYLSHAVDCAISALHSFCNKIKLKLSEIDEIFPSHYPIDFPKRLKEKLNGECGEIVDVTSKVGSVYTSGIIAAMKESQNKNFKNKVLISVGPGILIAIALYCSEESDHYPKG